MNPNLPLCFALAVIMVGCSKKDETSVPPPAPPAQPAVAAPTATAPVPTPAAASNTVVSAAATVMAGATNAAQTASAATNAAARNAMNTLGGLLNSSSPNTEVTSSAPGTPVAPNKGLPSLADLSSDQVTSALKEALGQGLQHAVASLGQPGGFLTNVNVKIPLPDKLQTVEKTLRAIGQGQLADQCITTMNQAAEQAVPAAADVFVSTMKGMSVDDAKGILNGPPDAATQFFRKSTEAELTQKFLPIVQQAMTKCGATAAYQQVLNKARAASPFFSDPSLDLNAYVTGKTMDGLFKMVADEEKRIRENPVARSTDLLKSVFGAIRN